MSDLRMKGTLSAPVYCRMPGNHHSAVKIVSTFDDIETSLYLTGADIAIIYAAYKRGPRELFRKPAGKPGRRHV